MSALLRKHRQPAPTAQDVSLALISGQRLSSYAHRKTPLCLLVSEAGQEQAQPIELPAGAVALLMDILEAMAAGRGLTVIPENAELTTVEAASLLNVSRPYLIKLLEQGVIPHRLVGKHRRVLVDDVLAYKDKTDQDRELILAQLTSEAQESSMGYSRP